MALCSICSTIPFSSLPHPHAVKSFTRIADEDDMPQLFYDREQIADDAALGLPWHEDMGALAAFAKSCPLCSLVQKGVQSWLDLYEDALRNNKAFAQFSASHTPIPTGERLWLTKRYGGSPGFTVLVRGGAMRSAILLTAVSFGVAADSPWARQFPLRPMNWDSGSSQSLQVAESWLSDCINRHDKCVDGETALPSRVLDIASSGDIIKLIDGIGLSGRYASLSYCWGDGPHYTTDQECIKLRQLGFHLSEIPKTLQDAIVIARHLGLRYLWIDSLCICQDDAEEWARESIRMTNVYLNAHIAIAANHAENSSVGCFHARKPRPIATVTLSGFCEGNENDVTVQALLLSPKNEKPWQAGKFESEPLSTRGWALQEHVLAKRVLHYNTQQMYFQCKHGIIGEDGCLFESTLPSLNVSEESQLEGGNHQAWNSLLWAYGQRKLTKATDKMLAISGLARLFAQRLGASYVAGLWSDDLIEGLAWQGLGSEKQSSEPGSEYIGPSWSWANYDGIAATGVRRRGFKDVAEIKDWYVKVKTDANPYGEVENAWIRIRAPMAKLEPSPIEDTAYELRLRSAGRQPYPRMRTRYSDDENGEIVKLDHRQARDSGEWRQWDLEILMLGSYPKQGKCGTNVEPSGDKEGDMVGPCYCMVVMKADDSEGTERMKRVGWMFLDAEEAAKVRASEECWRTVTIV